MHSLAQPRVWPMFLLAQLGLFLMLLMRFWQRGAETVLALDNPIPMPVALPTAAPATEVEVPETELPAGEEVAEESEVEAAPEGEAQEAAKDEPWQQDDGQ